MDTRALLTQAKKGFDSLKLDDKYKKAAYDNLKVWLTDNTFKEYQPQLTYLIKQKKWDFLLDSFYQVIPFGTGGRRGLVGIGTNRINTWTIQASAQGHAQYLKKMYGKDAEKRGIVISYDVRAYNQKEIYDDTIENPVMGLSCKDLAIAAAEVYAANNIKVSFFDGVRSTPELSFAIPHLKAVAGDMISASHNPPSDNGKKVYDEFGGQLIPPFDQHLVDEVTKKVTQIKTMNFSEAKKKNLIQIIGKEVDDAYIAEVLKLSLSKERKVNIVYSPLNGTGTTSALLVLKKAGFSVKEDPLTKHQSGAFEHVTFNNPNPEVISSFDTLIKAADTTTDILISNDPDADRVGIMVRHKGEWQFLNGNEIGIVLAEYAISKKKERNELKPYSTIIKTLVTTSLIEKICKENNIKCIGELLVGYKYIGDVMNHLIKKNEIDGFIMGTEESHGFNAGNYVHEKDGALPALWLAELAAEQKKKNRTVVDFLNNIYTKYGYCKSYLTEIRLLGAEGMESIQQIMRTFRNNEIQSFGSFKVQSKRDYFDEKPFLSLTDEVSKNVMVFQIKPSKGTSAIKVTVRPSGTEPKVKFYFEIVGVSCTLDKLAAEKLRLDDIRKNLEKDVLMYAYNSLSIHFPERGFLLFWQLPLNDKLKYFEIEEQLASLKESKNKKEELDKLLKFLGANPIKKVDDAFKAKYGKSIEEYLGL
jgi:phosphoglucomutase/phosphomannomutase